MTFRTLSLSSAVIAALLLGSAALTGCRTAADPDELSRVWNGATIEIPMADGSRGWQWFTQAQYLADRDVAGVWPVVIYMHGCSGGNAGTLAKVLVRHGFAVVTPSSTHRRYYNGSCKTVDGQLFWFVRGKEASAIRMADLTHTIEQVKAQPWADARNVFLVGQSEGGAAVAGFQSSSGLRSIRARVIGGIDCKWTGVRAGPDEPVLAILGNEDIALKQARGGTIQGSCGSRFPYPDNGSLNIVMDTAVHSLINSDRTAHKIIIEFLTTHLVR